MRYKVYTLIVCFASLFAATDEEWSVKYKQGEQHEANNEWDKALCCFLEAYQIDPKQCDPLAKIATHYRYSGKNDLAHMFAKLGSSIAAKDDSRFEHELAIVSYYTNFKEDGYVATNSLVLRRNIPWSVKNGTYWNMQFYVSPLKNAKYIPLSPELPLIIPTSNERYRPMNPSIQRTKSGYEVICRGVNHTQVGAVQFNTIDPDQIFRSKSYLMQLDRNFNVLSQQEINENIERERVLTHYSASHVVGAEDCRLFTLNNKNCFTCCYRDTDATGLPKMVFCELENATVKRFVPLKGPEDPNRCERNWMQLIKDDSLYLIYLCNPFTLYKANLQTGDCERVFYYETPDHDFSHFRGSAAPIPFDDGYLLMIHEIAYEPNNARAYFHRFIYLDKDLMIKKMSKPFIFKQLGIEFCSSMTLDHLDANLILALGREDSEAFLVSVDLPTIRSLLEPTPLTPLKK